MSKRSSIEIAGETIEAGTAKTVKLSMSMLHSSTSIEVPINVFHGKKDGPVLFVIAALHGDEINGVEIIRRLHHSSHIKRIRGTLITLPIVNVYGFLLQSRYLPDRRDLNRQFPGSPTGSLAARLANLLMNEVISHATHGIDLHTGALHRSNYPQTRYSKSCQGSAALAKAFGAPIMIPSPQREGSLRQSTQQLDIPTVVFEGGEALRFDEFAIKVGLRGIIHVMAHLDMLPPHKAWLKENHTPVSEAQSTYWVRSPSSGTVTHTRPLGVRVKQGEQLGLVVDPLGDDEQPVLAPAEGVIIGKSNIPLSNMGDALFHLALFEDLDRLHLPKDVHFED